MSLPSFVVNLLYYYYDSAENTTHMAVIIIYKDLKETKTSMFFKIFCFYYV